MPPLRPCRADSPQGESEPGITFFDRGGPGRHDLLDQASDLEKQALAEHTGQYAAAEVRSAFAAGRVVFLANLYDLQGPFGGIDLELEILEEAHAQ